MAFYHKIHCKFTGVKGFVRVYEDGLKYRMLTEKAKYKAKVLVFWEKHGLEATMDAFPVKRSALFLWKKILKENQGKMISLNDKKRIPRTTRKREWSFEVRQKIKSMRANELHPNLGPDKIHPLLKIFCKECGFKCSGIRTITRIIADDPEKMRIFPQWQKEQLSAPQALPLTINFPCESKIGWRYTAIAVFCFLFFLW